MRLASLVAACALLAACSSGSSTPAASPSPTGPSPGAVVGRLSPAQIKAAAPSPDLAAAAGVKPADAARATEIAATVPWLLIKAGGVTQAIGCVGSGTPTVVLFNGLLLQASWTWPLVVDQVQKGHRVCMFDRPGTGLSSPRPATASPNGPAANADEALAMLSAAGESGPYIFVGWSYGGLVSQVAAKKAGADLAGLVLVDGVGPIAYRTSDTQGWEEAGTTLDMKSGEAAIGEGADLGSTPLVVIEATGDGSFGGAGESAGNPGGSQSKLWHADQVLAARNSTNSVLALTKAPHQVPQVQPRAVVAAIDAVASGSPVKGACETTFAKVGLDCA